MSQAPGTPHIPLGRIAELCGAQLEGDPRVEIRGVAGLEDAREGDLSFLASARYNALLENTRASAVLLVPGTPAPGTLAVLRAKDPYLALIRVLPLFDAPRAAAPAGIHPSAVVGRNVTLGEGASVGPLACVEDDVVLGARTRIGPGCVLERGARVGDDCVLHARVVLARGCILGNRVIVQPGVVIGADGFGYTFEAGAYRKVPQVGIVEIGDDVEIGANTCIDRATIGRTSVGRGSKIDNLVQLAHNVALGDGCAVAGLAGVAGSTRIGRGVRIGGQAGIGGHARIGDGATIGGQAGVVGDIDAGATVTGYPARDHRTMMRVHAAMLLLPALIRRVRALEKALTGRAADPAEE